MSKIITIIIVCIVVSLTSLTIVRADISTPSDPIGSDTARSVKGELSHVFVMHTKIDPILRLVQLRIPSVDKRKQMIKQLVRSIAAIEDKGLGPMSGAACRKKYPCEKVLLIKRVSSVRREYLHKRCLRRVKWCAARGAAWVARRHTIAEAALSAQEKTGVDATLLIAIGRMESDFRNLVLLNSACKYRRRNYNCYADCGMTQHHVRGSLGYVMRECRKLSRSPAYSFLKSAQELARHITWCQDPKNARYNKPFRRCILNRYNMGPFYKRAERCDREFRCWSISKRRYPTPEGYQYAYSDCVRRRGKCRAKAAYWKKVSCFEYGARNQVTSKRSCRKCYRINQIPVRFYDPLDKDNGLNSLLRRPPFSTM
jgi:hypothetical protein